MMLAHTSAIVTTLTKGAIGSTRRTTPGSHRLTPIPATTGRTTTWSVERNSPIASTSTSLPARSFVSSGVRITAASVVQVVMITESATSARARYVTTFDAVPPGQQATRISPTAKGVSSPRAVATPKPANGMMRNWPKNPATTAPGRDATRRKSSIESVSPIPSMITARPTTIMSPRNQVNSPGCTSASPQATSTHAGNALASESRSFIGAIPKRRHGRGRGRDGSRHGPWHAA